MEGGTRLPHGTVMKRLSAAASTLLFLVSISGCSESSASPPATTGPDGSSLVPVIEHIRIAASGFTFDALASGPESGELVMLLHGFPTTSREWEAQIIALAKVGYRAVAPDQRGYSPDARPTDVASYAIPALIVDVLAMVDSLGRERFHVVGHDWGGGIAWGLAGIAPDRVLSLTALSTPHPGAFAAALADPNSCQYGASAYFQVLGAPDSDLRDVAALGDAFDGVPQEIVQEYFERVLLDPVALDAALNWYRANVADGMLSGAASLGAITVPTLYLWGTDDRFFCRETVEATAAHVSAPYRLVELDGIGHWVAETVPDVVSEEILAHVGE